MTAEVEGETAPYRSSVRIRDEGVVWRQLDGEIIVLEMNSGSYLNLNGPGKVLWLALAEQQPVEALPGLLVSTYGITEDRARNDSSAFVADLLQRSLLVPVE